MCGFLFFLFLWLNLSAQTRLFPHLLWFSNYCSFFSIPALVLIFRSEHVSKSSSSTILLQTKSSHHPLFYNDTNSSNDWKNPTFPVLIIPSLNSKQFLSNSKKKELSNMGPKTKKIFLFCPKLKTKVDTRKKIFLASLLQEVEQ